MMYGLVIKRGNTLYAAVAPRKRAFREWQDAIDKATHAVSAHDCAWRMRDASGWIDGSDNASRAIPDFPHDPVVFW